MCEKATQRIIKAKHYPLIWRDFSLALVSKWNKIIKITTQRDYLHSKHKFNWTYALWGTRSRLQQKGVKRSICQQEGDKYGKDSTVACLLCRFNCITRNSLFFNKKRWDFMLTSALSSIYPQLINILKRLCFVVVVGRIFFCCLNGASVFVGTRSKIALWKIFVTKTERIAIRNLSKDFVSLLRLFFHHVF